MHPLFANAVAVSCNNPKFQHNLSQKRRYSCLLSSSLRPPNLKTEPPNCYIVQSRSQQSIACLGYLCTKVAAIDASLMPLFSETDASASTRGGAAYGHFQTIPRKEAFGRRAKNTNSDKRAIIMANGQIVFTANLNEAIHLYLHLSPDSPPIPAPEFRATSPPPSTAQSPQASSIGRAFRPLDTPEHSPGAHSPSLSQNNFVCKRCCDTYMKYVHPTTNIS